MVSYNNAITTLALNTILGLQIRKHGYEQVAALTAILKYYLQKVESFERKINTLGHDECIGLPLAASFAYL